MSASSTRAAPARHARVHAWPTGCALDGLEQLQGRRGGGQMPVGEMEVAQRRADVAVAHEALDRVHVDAGFQ